MKTEMPFSAGLIKRNDRDIHTLAKYYDASPVFRKYLDDRMKNGGNYFYTSGNWNNYKNKFFPERANFNFWSAVSSTSETTANIALLAVGGLSLFSSGKLTALGSAQGGWGASRNAGKLADYNVLKAKVDPAIFKTETGRNWFWENVNKPFLDKAIEKGGKFKLFDNPNGNMIYHEGNPSNGYNFFGREVNYLESKGYIIKENLAIPSKK
ncbi:MAG: hypothetical protein ABI091_24735 [Ferruginibacter sp.]